MKRFVLTGIYVVFLCFLSYAQEDKAYDKLTFLFVDERYEDCLFKAAKYMESDEHRKDPEPYLYYSMSNYEISKKEELREKYPNALKEAIKYAAKFISKDKEGDLTSRYTEFLENLKGDGLTTAMHYYRLEEFRKAASEFKNIVKFAPDDYAMWLWKGVCEIKSVNASEGNLSLQKAMEGIRAGYKPDNTSRKVYYEGLIEYKAIALEQGKNDDANLCQSIAPNYKQYDPKEVEKKQAEQQKAKNEEHISKKKQFHSVEEDQ